MGSCLFSSPSPDTATPNPPKQIPTMTSPSSSSSLKVCCNDWKKLRNGKKKKRSEDGAALYGRHSAIRSSSLSSSSSVTGIGSGREIREEELHRLPGRMFLNGASDVACLYTQQGKKGPNQDAMLVWENFASRRDTIFCGVFDGHGPYGHMVSKKVRDALPLKLCAQWRSTLSGQNSPCLNDSVHGSIYSEESIGHD